MQATISSLPPWCMNGHDAIRHCQLAPGKQSPHLWQQPLRSNMGCPVTQHFELHTAGKAWQTPFGMCAPVIEGVPVTSCAAHSVVLQLPLEGILQGGGLSAVLKRPEGSHPEWLTQHHGRNFFVSFAEVCCSQDGLRHHLLGH